ncbi:hypothetical protein VTI74DRAFT_2330 [Chaetomium olivicolor]
MSPESAPPCTESSRLSCSPNFAVLLTRLLQCLPIEANWERWPRGPLPLHPDQPLHERRPGVQHAPVAGNHRAARLAAAPAEPLAAVQGQRHRALQSWRLHHRRVVHSDSGHGAGGEFAQHHVGLQRRRHLERRRGGCHCDQSVCPRCAPCGTIGRRRKTTTRSRCRFGAQTGYAWRYVCFVGRRGTQGLITVASVQQAGQRQPGRGHPA